MPFAEIPYFMSTLRDRDSLGARALELTILTAVRSGEMLGAKWCEFDLATQTWTIPAERMKARREHRIPLSDYAVELISKLSRGSEFVFQGAKRGKQVSNMTMAAVLKRMHLGHFTVHGFRSTFRDWAAETTNTPNHVVEMALAHVIGDKVEAAYRRGDLFEKRRELMNVWSEFCSEGSTTYPNSDQTATTEKHREEGSGPW
jgi:integrase